jgi:myosin-crossreactive antigen
MRIKSTGSLVGGSIRFLAAAAFMSRNGNLPGDHISILLEGKNFGKLVVRVGND